MKKMFISAIFSVLMLIAGVSSVSAQTASCLSLTVDIKSGEIDKTPNGPIRQLQKYLVQEGYLTATPNGRVGPATLSAIKKFQVANAISGTGTVGPLTRATIQRKSCTTASTPVTQTPTTSHNASTETVISGPGNVPVSSVVTPSAPSAPQPNISSPKSGDTLTIGTSQAIQWYNPTGAPYDFVLERNDRGSGGYIATGVRDSGSFFWRVGKVLVASSNTEQVTATGTYRIRLQKTSGASDSDPVSTYFTIAAPPFTINTISPSVVPADNTAAVVLYGSGFANVAVYFDAVFNMPARVSKS